MHRPLRKIQLILIPESCSPGFFYLRELKMNRVSDIIGEITEGDRDYDDFI